MRRGLAGLMGAAALLLAGGAGAETVAERLPACLGCHGESGTSATEGVPSLGGQRADYVVTQLFQFREGQRTAPPMNEMAKGLSDDDLRAFADAIAALPPAKAAGPAADAALAERAKAALAKHQCTSCHGPDLTGQDAIPRIRAQRREYLAAALAGYRSNARPGYDAAMNEAAQDLKDDEIADLAAYISGL
ncbi:c-type cytochrome [Methylobacterium gnaphalii]|nr:Cytochrome c4 [Methylobacterium gnaphalii]